MEPAGALFLFHHALQRVLMAAGEIHHLPHLFGRNQSRLVDPQRLAGGLALGLRTDGQALDGLQLFQVAREVIKHSDSFTLHLPSDVENFSELPLGYLLAEDIADTRWVVDEPGARIIFPNPKVKNGLRAGLLVVPVAAE